MRLCHLLPLLTLNGCVVAPVEPPTLPLNPLTQTLHPEQLALPTWVHFVRFPVSEVSTGRVPRHQPVALTTDDAWQQAEEGIQGIGAMNHAASAVERPSLARHDKDTPSHTSPKNTPVALNKASIASNAASPAPSIPCEKNDAAFSAQSERWLYTRTRARFTIQLYSTRHDDCANAYLEQINAPKAHQYTVFHQDALWRIALTGEFDSITAAQVVAQQYPGAWVRRLQVLRQRRCATRHQLPSGIQNTLKQWCDTALAQGGPS